MPQQLARPLTTKLHELNGESGNLRWALSSMQGYREEMEDQNLVQMPFAPSHPEWSLFAVFDGHGSVKLEDWAREIIVPTMLDEPLIQQVLKETEATHGVLSTSATIEILEDGIRAAFQSANEKLKESLAGKVPPPGTRWGTTFIGVLITRRHFVFINCGDSRGFLSRHSEEIPRKKDTYANTETYSDAEKGIAFVTRDHDDCYRALGDERSPIPDVSVVERDEGSDQFIVLGCDGIFDIFSNVELRDLVVSRAATNNQLLGAVNQVLDVGIAWEHKKNKHDNMSLAVILLSDMWLSPDQAVVEREAKWLSKVDEALRNEYMAEFNDSNSRENYEERVQSTDFEKLCYKTDEKDCYKAHPGMELVPDPLDMMSWLVEEKGIEPLPQQQGGNAMGEWDLAQVAINAVLEPLIADFHRAFLADKAKYKGVECGYWPSKADVLSKYRRTLFKEVRRDGADKARLDISDLTNANVQKLLSYCSPSKLEMLRQDGYDLNEESLRCIAKFTHLKSFSFRMSFKDEPSLSLVNTILRSAPIEELSIYKDDHYDKDAQCYAAACAQLELPSHLKRISYLSSKFFNHLVLNELNRHVLERELFSLHLAEAHDLTDESARAIKAFNTLRCLRLASGYEGVGRVCEALISQSSTPASLPNLRVVEMDRMDLEHLPALAYTAPNLEHLSIGSLRLLSATEKRKSSAKPWEKNVKEEEEEDEKAGQLLSSSLCSLGALRSLELNRFVDFKSTGAWLQPLAELGRLEWLKLKEMEIEPTLASHIVRRCPALTTLDCKFKIPRIGYKSEDEIRECLKGVIKAADEAKNSLPEERRAMLHLNTVRYGGYGSTRSGIFDGQGQWVKFKGVSEYRKSHVYLENTKC